MSRTKNVTTTILQRTTALTKLLLCSGLAILIFTLQYFFKVETLSNLMLSWDTFSASMIALSWIVFLTTDADQLCVLVKRQDESLPIIFLIVSISVCFSFFGILTMLTNSEVNLRHETFQKTISLLGIGLSWILLHTIFTFRYAHLYHDHNSLNTGSQVGGVNFPGKKEPDYFDFAYLSFVIGMTFQVSDVKITSPVIRRLVLAHGFVSFIFNTIIVALTINTIVNLKQQ